jgi:hypothetical protein
VVRIENFFVEIVDYFGGQLGQQFSIVGKDPALVGTNLDESRLPLSQPSLDCTLCVYRLARGGRTIESKAENIKKIFKKKYFLY